MAARPRDQMKTNWTGLRGLEQEDAVISLSMGPIFDRTKEHLVAADRAVMRLRRRILDNIELVQKGEAPLGARLPDLTKLLATDMTVPAGTSWQDIAAPNLSGQRRLAITRLSVRLPQRRRFRAPSGNVAACGWAAD